MAINFLYPTNTRPEIQINDTDDNPRLAFLESDVVSGGISTTGGNLVFETSSGTERARILSGGNFGIDNTDPKQKLSVAGIINSDSNEDYYGAWLSGNSTAGSQNYLGLGPWYSQAGYVRYFDNDRLSIYTYDATEDVTLQEAGGKVGIGITTPVSVFQVQETQNAESLITLSNNRQDAGDVPIFGIVAQNAGTNVAKISFYREGGSSTGHLAFSTKASNSASLTEKMRIDANGNVGIGETNPAVPLHISRDFASGENIALLLDNNNTTAGSEIGMLFRCMTGGANTDFEIFGKANAANDMDLVFQSDGSNERVRFTGDGKVGIGTAAPAGKLTVRGSIMAINSDTAYNAGYFASMFSDYGPNALKLTSRTGDVFLASDYGATVTLQTGNPNSPALYINSNKRVQFNGYNSTNQTGTPTYLLGTDASGNIVKTNTVPGSSAGPYLPLAGGTMTGTIVGPTAGSSSANPPALEVVASGTANEQASIAIQQKTSEGDTIIFADYEPHVEWGISTENGANEIQFTAGNSTNSLSSKTLYNNAGNARTAYVKFNHNLGNGNTEIGGTLDVGQALTVSSTATANSFTSSTDTGISINGITMTRVAANSAIRVSNGLETLGLLRSYAGLNVATSAVIGSTTQGNTLIVTSAQAALNTAFSSAGNGGYTQYQSGNDGIYGYIGTGSHLLSPVVNNNDFVARAQGEFVVSIGATERLRINSSGNTILSGSLLPNVNGGGSLGIGTKQFSALHLTSGSAITFANGDASIVEGEVGSYSLSFRTYDGTSNSRALLLEGNNDATFAGKAYGVTPIATDLDTMLATKKYVDDSITGGANYLGVWDPDDSLK